MLLQIRLCVLVSLLDAVFLASISKTCTNCLTEQCKQAAYEMVSVMDRTTDPCEDFYQFACGNFPKRHPIPADKTLWDYYQMHQSRMDDISRQILESSRLREQPEAVTKAQDMYSECMNTDALDKRGLDPVVELLNSWGGWPVLHSDWQEKKFDWNTIGNIAAEYAIQFIFSISSLANLDNANTTAIYLDVPSLNLPTPLRTDTEIPDMRQLLEVLKDSRMPVEDLPFTKYLIKMATLLREHLNTSVSDEDIVIDMRSVVLFMQKLSNVGNVFNQDTLSEAPRKYSWTLAELNQWSNDFLGNSSINWIDFLQRAFSKSGVTISPDLPIIIDKAENLGALVSLVEQTDTRILHNFILSRLLVFLAPETNEDMRKAALEFYIQQGYIKSEYPRWLYCVHKVQDYPSVGFSHAVSYQYRYSSFENRNLDEAKEMVEDLQAAFQSLLIENQWMDDETRQSAAKKAQLIFMLLGFPSWTDTGEELDMFYQQMQVKSDDHFGNVARLRSFNQALNFATLGEERDRNEWTQSPLIVNAFYNSLNNRVTFPVGMMNNPFLSGDAMQRAIDYARIGSVVGHEITHGFDSVGRSYDAFGTAVDWWVNGTDARFEERAQCLVDQYSNYTIPDINATVDGVKTLRENIADNGGIREAFSAFKRLRSRKNMPRQSRLPGLEMYTEDQLFFIGFATIWCRAETAEGLAMMQSKDTHSPNKYRVIGPLSNMAEFSEVFSCPEGSSMNPAKKCVLW